jgi:DNA-binding transcriptional regulator YiaG
MDENTVLTTHRFISGSDLRKIRHNVHLTTVKIAKIAGVKTHKTYENWEKNVGMKWSN